MSKPRLLALWPCHSWEDFPTEMSESAAASLFACWTALWHPNLITRFESIPGFWRVDKIDELPPGSCVSVPDFSRAKMDEAGWDSLKAISDSVVSGQTRQQLLAELNVPPTANLAAGFASDFFSLGFCWLQVHLMTRQIRYAGGLDEDGFGESLVAAATEFNTDPDSKQIQSRLQRCFDLLLEERNRFYPSDASLYRIVIARPVLDASLLLGEVSCDSPLNVLATTADLFALELSAPDVLQKLREKKENGQLSFLSAGRQELPTLHCHSATATRNMAEGQRDWTTLTGSEADVFARRTSGLSPVDPEIAAELGCRLALHAVFDADPAPEMSAPNALWQSPGGEPLPVIAGKPLDAGREVSLLHLGIAIGEMIDSWHYAHILIGYWPGHQSDSFRDLTRSMRYGNLMGRFRLLSKAVETLATQTWGETIEADDYDFRPALMPREPALRRASALRSYWRQTLECLHLKKAAAILSLVEPDFKSFLPQLEEAGSRIDRALGEEPGTETARNEIDQELAAIRSALAGPHPGQVLVHASNQAAVVTVSQQTQPDVNERAAAGTDFEATNKSDSLRFLHRGSTETLQLVRAPAAGVVGLGLDNNSGLNPVANARQPRMVDGNSLRNEFLSIDINPRSGGIASIQHAGKRGSLASQRLAIRMSKSDRADDSQKYASMEVDSIEFHETGRISAACLARGRLVWQDRTLARFEQRASLSREQPFLVLDITIIPLKPFRGGLWGSSVCSRLAWTDEMSNRFRFLQEARTRCCREFFSSPLCTEIESGDERISLFTGGNAWHRQSALNIMDTLLPESPDANAEVSYRIGIGLDVANPLETAVGLLTTPMSITRQAAFPENDFRIAGWGKSTLHWYDAGVVRDVDTTSAGLSFRFRESQGKAGQMSVRFAQPPDRVELQDFAGKRVGTPQVIDGRIEFAYRAWQYIDLAVYWNQ